MNLSTTTMKTRTFNFLDAGLSAATWTFVGLGLITGYLQWAQYSPAFEVVNPENHRAIFQAPNHLLVTREFKVNRERTFAVYNSLSAPNIDKPIELPVVMLDYTPGTFVRDRVLEIPPIKPGEYILNGAVCWKPNILRSECLGLPRLTLVVGE